MPPQRGCALPGSFIYTPASGTVLNAGNSQALQVDFTPSDTNNYTNATKIVHINVQKVTLTASIIGNPTKPYDTTTSATLTAANFALSGLVAARALRSRRRRGPITVPT